MLIGKHIRRMAIYLFVSLSPTMLNLIFDVQPEVENR